MLRRLRATSLVLAALLASCTTPTRDGSPEGDLGAADETAALGAGHSRNSPPRVIDVRFDPSNTVGQCEPTQIVVTTFDRDGDSLTFTWKATSLPSRARPTLQATGNAATFSSDVVGTYVITVSVDDRKGHVTRQAITIHVVDGTACNVTFASIIHAYHGMLLDRNLNEIQLSRAVIDRLQDSMIKSLTSLPQRPQPPNPAARSHPRPRPPLDPDLVQRVLKAAPSDDLRVLSKSVLIQKGINAAPAAEKAAYQFRLDLIFERSLNFLQAPLPDQAPLRTFFGIFDLIDIIDLLVERIRAVVSTYNFQCAANGVPVPASWPAGWTNHGMLPPEFIFAGAGKPSQVWTFENAQGVCYALPRLEGNVISLVGIICQSNTTGRACFWDNLENGTGRRITGTSITLQLAQLQNGSNLTENCTECHRGNNAFMIHPDTILANVAARDPAVRYSPLGQPSWVNPPPFSPLESGACSGCHEIGATTPGYCAILRKAADLTMPPAPGTPAGWDTPADAYAAHISSFKVPCGPTP